MKWNYRVIFHDKDEPSWFGLHEVYYENGEVLNWTANAVSFVADEDEGAVGITQSLEMALQDAGSRPVLVESELP